MHTENGSKIDDIQRLALNGAIFDKWVACKKERDELLSVLKSVKYELSEHGELTIDTKLEVDTAIAKA